MPAIPILSTESIRSFIEQRQVVTFDQLTSEFHCSYMSILRRKEELGYLTSYNRYGIGLTLPTIPIFNKFNIWKYGDFLFSKWGDVKSTIVGVVDESPEGLYARDLQRILNIRVNNHLSMCVRENKVFKCPDFGHPVYFSTVVTTRNAQYRLREKRYQDERPVQSQLLSQDKVIKILLLIIKHRVTSAHKLKPLVALEGLSLSERSIQWVLDKYDIQKKGSL